MGAEHDDPGGRAPDDRARATERSRALDRATHASATADRLVATRLGFWGAPDHCLGRVPGWRVGVGAARYREAIIGDRRLRSGTVCRPTVAGASSEGRSRHRAV